MLLLESINIINGKRLFQGQNRIYGEGSFFSMVNIFKGEHWHLPWYEASTGPGSLIDNAGWCQIGAVWRRSTQVQWTSPMGIVIT